MTHNQVLFAGGDRPARGLQAILAACLVAATALPTVAATRTWDDDGGIPDKNWSTAANWDPDGVPGITPNVNDIVFIGEHPSAWHDAVQLDIDGVQVLSLTLWEGADLSTNDHELIVNGNTVLSGGTGFELSQLVVEDHGAADSFDTDTMDVVYGARVDMRGGILEVDSGPLYIDADSDLVGWGRVDLEYNDGGSGTTVLNSGTIEASGGDLLVQIAGTGNGLMRLGPDSTVATTGGDLTFYGNHSQYFQIDGAHVDIQNGNTLTVEAPSPWDMQTGRMTFTDGGTLAGMQMIMRTAGCNIDVHSGTAVFDASLYVEQGTLNVVSGASLRLNEHAHFLAGSTLTFLYGGGSLFEVNADTEINQDMFNWDGATTTTIAGDAVLTINSDEIENLTNDGFDGTVNVHGRLGVFTDAEWTLEGTMNLFGPVDEVAWVYGTKIGVAGPHDSNADVVAISGHSGISAPIDFDDGADLTVRSDARLDLQGAAAFTPGSETVVDGNLFLDAGVTYAGGTISGTGSIFQVSDAIVNASTTIDLDGGYDWDGMVGIIANTLISEGNGLTLNVDKVEMQDANPGHNGQITVESSVLTVNTTIGAWSLGAGGDLILQKTGADMPTVNGSVVVAYDGAQIITAGSAVINAPVTLREGSQIFLFEVAGSELTLAGATTLDGGEINGPKSGEVVVQSSPLTVTGISTVLVSTYDWDQGPTTVEPGGALTIASDHIDVGNNQYDATITINSGSLAVNTSVAWTMDGWLNLNNTTGTFPLLAGQDLIVGDGVAAPDARINVGGTGISRITADVAFESDAMVSIASGAQLDLDGAVMFQGGSDIAGVLNVTTPWNMSAAAQLGLSGGEVMGATITNDGTTSGFGMITTSQFHNNGTLTAVGGTLVIDTISSPDLDGTGSGVVRAEGGDIVVVDPIFSMFTGTVTVGAGRTITFQGGWSLDGDGVLNLNGGPTHAQYARVDGGLVGLAADVVVDWEGRFYAPTWFWSDARVSLPDTDDSLRLYEDAAVAAGATFSGNGDLANAQGATLTLDDGASVGVRLLNSGRLEIGSSAGAATVAGYYPASLGSLEIEIGGRVAGSEFDRLLVDGEAMLAGILDVSLIDPAGGANVFIPSAGDTFEIVTATGGLGDTAFTSTLLPELSGGLFFDVLYGPNAVTLMVSILGDFDLDGDVDGTDFLAWQRGESPDPFSTSDLTVWEENYGNIALLSAISTTIPEPGAGTLVMVAGLLGWLAPIRRRGTTRARTTGWNG